jgi:hypothetical protein
MKNKVIIGCFLILILTSLNSINFTLAELNGEEKAKVKSSTFNDMEWDVTFGGIHSEEGDTLVQTTDGGYALGGRADSDGGWNFDMWLVKTDGYGQEEWNVTYGGIEGEGLYSMVQTADGGYALLGETFSYGAKRNGIIPTEI